jgi:hypothetical protein
MIENHDLQSPRNAGQTLVAIYMIYMAFLLVESHRLQLFFCLLVPIALTEHPMGLSLTEPPALPSTPFPLKDPIPVEPVLNLVGLRIDLLEAPRTGCASIRGLVHRGLPD